MLAEKSTRLMRTSTISMPKFLASSARRASTPRITRSRSVDSTAVTITDCP